MNTKAKDRLFTICNTIFMIILALIVLYPIWYVLIASFSEPMKVANGSVMFLPKGFELSSYKKVFTSAHIWSSYGNTILYAVAGTALNMGLTILGAYPLSKKVLPFRRVFTFVILLAMWFNAGMMPTFLNYKSLGLYDTRVAVLLCGAINTFNLILLRTFFENVPAEVEESAKIDGANDWTILRRIYLPLSKPALITVTMYYFVDRWNGYFWSMLLLKDQNKIPLQVLLKKLIVEIANSSANSADVVTSTINQQTMIYATIVIAILPMIIIYPFFQKYFSKGVMVGAIKG